MLTQTGPRAMHVGVLNVQSLDDDQRSGEAFATLMKFVVEGLAKMPPLTVDGDWIIKQVENFGILNTFARKCDTIGDYYVLTQMAYRLFTGEVLSNKLGKMIDRLFQEDVQALDFGDVLRTLRQSFDGVVGVAECPLARKLTSLYSYMLTLGYLKAFGLTITDEDYSKLEQRALQSTYSSKKSFYVCLIDTVLFICERLHEFRTTGDVSTFLHSGATYGAWLQEADKIIALAPFTSNLAAHGTTYFAFLADLRDLCERGRAYAKFMANATGTEATAIKRKLATLELISNTEITKRAAAKERDAPMGVLIHGSSSVAKSAFTKMLYRYYGSLFDLETTDEFRYVRNPMDEYWSNFDSSKWCIQLDDIAFRNPVKTTDVDPTLQDLLNVVNNVPYVPPQAELENKGRTPVMAKLVLATSNSADLNAREYFWCPLAVRRRLPYVVHVCPKDEYKHENGVFIDPLKIPESTEAFPDLWVITVKKLVPVMQNGREHAKLETIKMFTSSREFLTHFGQACRAHEANQARALAADQRMATMQVCKKCCAPLPHEKCLSLQSLDMGQMTVMLLLMSILQWFLTFGTIWKVIDCVSRTRFLTRATFAIINRVASETQLVAFYGRFVDFKARHARAARVTLTTFSLLLGAYFMYKAVSESRNKVNTEPEAAEEAKAQHEVQGNTVGTSEQLQKEATQNVWYNPTIELTKFDVPVASNSLVGITPERLRDLIGRNCVLLRIRVNGESTVRIMRGVFTRGHRCLTNGHAFKPTGTTYSVEIIQAGTASGVTPNITIRLTREDIAFASHSDLCMFEVDSIPPFKDITHLWAKSQIHTDRAHGFMREDSGSLSMHTVYAMELLRGNQVEGMPNPMDYFFGMSSRATEMGMCGSLYVSLTPRGPVIVGIHMLGNDTATGILSVVKSELDALEEMPAITKRPVVQAGDEPNLSCAKRTLVLGPLHHKSLFRYLPTGTCRLYGSFVGFRPKPRSRVTSTPLHTEVLEHYGVENNYGQPVMSGWIPWRKNVIEMVQPNVTYKRGTLRKAREGYLQDVLSALPDGWQKELVTLTNHEALNGVPGVKYIDRVNTNTSMGSPWNTTKKEFLRPAPTETEPDALDFTPEIWERVKQIEALYKEGKRAYPVFTGHLKDEATPLAKVAMGKTRLFTGAPVDWSLVVRRRLLPFVRLVQKNKFVFEAGPGTVAQSKEWGQIRAWLVKHGLDRLIAGDYGKYDKRMLADFILAAFHVIVDVYRAAGFADTDLRALMCIGEDIAFSICNIDGDLVEFFGTNPSGHPLTVIINSLVNALYMRYAYCELNPEHEVATFRERVSLFTYGDDNTAGVSESAPWFNHTAIQQVFAGIGVEYTMADKSAESKPYIHIDEVSFLKRKWVWNDEVGDWMAPLEEESIIKSLTMWVPSQTVSREKQMVDVVESAISEYFFYGREKFEEKSSFFSKLLQAEPFCFYVKKSTFPTYDTLVERFHRASAAL